jgi:hypothetical protein
MRAQNENGRVLVTRPRSETDGAPGAAQHVDSIITVTNHHEGDAGTLVPRRALAVQSRVASLHAGGDDAHGHPTHTL